jgi:2-succinyl-5-enolpyruvyl-6-hydroxy-3-cyclohexene-1-carboxylate synthase
VTEAHEGDLAFAHATALIEAVTLGGAVGACVSPGSRSTPLALAIARHGRIPVHVHLDERSSAFFALGMAKATGMPALAVTTSGTAVANMLPAVVEAAMSRAPLIVLTADRPPDLRGTGANQTIDQVGIFGVYPRWAVDVEPPSAEPGGPGSWGELGTMAAALALGPPAGPVHLNLPFREPLVPTAVGYRCGVGADPSDVGAGTERASVGAERQPGHDAVERLGTLIAETERGIVLLGGLPPWLTPADLLGVERVATATGWPVLAEPASNLRRPAVALGAGQHLLADAVFGQAMRPDAVLQIGAPPTSKAAIAAAAATRRLAVLAEDAPASDPTRSAEVSLSCDFQTVARIADAWERGTEPSGWASAWAEADAAARAALDTVLDRTEEPFEGRLARDLFAALPAGSSLFAGSSMPIRDLDAYAAPRPAGGVRVVANRGASGIDGSVSTTLGIAAADRGGGATCALIGDLALLHDASALLWSGRRGGTGALFVVPNNRGGGIFDHLAVAAIPERDALFVTPHTVDLAALCAAAGASHQRVERGDRFADAVRGAAAAARERIHVIEVPIEREAGMTIRAGVRDAIRTALAALGHA